MSQTESRIVVVLDGADVSPATLDVLDLSELLPKLRAAFCAAAGIESKHGPGDPASLCLKGVGEGSAAIALSGSRLVTLGADAVSDALAGGGVGRLPFAARAALSEVSSFVVKRGWLARFYGSAGQAGEISRANPVARPEHRRVRGTTTIYGRVNRVGGENATARIQLEQAGAPLTVELSKELARDLGGRLYEVVGLEGEAVWRPGDWEIVEFRATRLLTFKRSGAAEAFRALSDEAGGRWDGVDADAYTKDIRAEGDDE